MAVMKRVASRFVLVLLALPLLAVAKPLPLWELEGGSNRVLLMGSVHFLRPSDYPLREGLQQAYDIADTLVMEIDMTKVDQMQSQATIAALSLDPEGRSLQDLVGETDYARAAELAGSINIPIMTFSQFEPWFAALSITQLRMVQLGFDPSWGVEAMLTRKAVTEGKSLGGLETLEEQLGFLDGLSASTQSTFLLQSLEDAATVQNEVEAIVEAWSNGDTAALETSLLKGVDDVPELYDALLVRRNRNWVAPIAALRDQPGNYLVIVGAMHLVGEDSVLAMLEEQGIGSRQLTDDDF